MSNPKRPHRCPASALAIALGLLAAQAPAGPDASESQDHPLLARVKGYTIVNYKEKESDDANFCMRTSKHGTKVKGRYWRFTYRRPRAAKQPTAEQVRGHYRALLNKWHASPLCESPPDLDARVVRDGVETWVHLRAFSPGDTYELEIVEPAGR